jgi:hypothetical protein
MKRWALLIGFAACAQPSGTSETNTQIIHVDFVDNKTRVTAPGYQMTFGAAGTVRLPEQLAIIGEFPRGNVLGIDTCPRESLIGASIYPGATTFGGQSLSAAGETGTSDSFLELAGPAVARVRVTYSVPYSCGSKQHLKGEQTMTFFPDGRIVRRDVVTSSDTELPGGVLCGCDNIMVPDSGYFFTLSYAFASGAQIVDNMERITQQGDLTEVCARFTDATIGLRWLDASNTRISPNAQPSFVLDMMTSSSAPFPVVSNATHVSHMMIASANTSPSCGGVLAQMTQVPIVVDDMTITAGSDGIYTDAREHASAFSIHATKAVPPFALLLKLGDHAKITSSVHADKAFFTVQIVDTGSKILWFRDGLAAGELVTIEPL